jgi:histone-lysine N-methyltransferase SETMAR
MLANDLNMNRVCARWLPQILTAEHLTKRVELSKQFIKKVNRGGIRFLDRIITTDESWFHYCDPETKQQSSQWKNGNSPSPKKAKITKSLGKNMFILFMDRKGMLNKDVSFSELVPNLASVPNKINRLFTVLDL